MNNIPLLSIIVLCYNVSAFLDRCLESIVNQSYHNTEILLINDGSTDKTGERCEMWATKDNRIQVIHQKNLGLSATRSKGVKIAKGDLITFVDADDWIHPQMYSLMIGVLCSENADIAQCGVCDTFKTSTGILYKNRKCTNIKADYTVHNRVEGCLKILRDIEWQSYMWNKIYKKELLKQIQFPIGRGLDEDASVMHLIFNNAKKSVYLNSEMYYYFHREGSICSSKDPKSVAKKLFDRCSCRWERYLFVKQNTDYHNILNEVGNRFVSAALMSLRFVYSHRTFFSPDYPEILRKRILAIHLTEYLPLYFSKLKRVEYFLYRKAFPLYRILAKCIK